MTDFGKTTMPRATCHEMRMLAGPTLCFLASSCTYVAGGRERRRSDNPCAYEGFSFETRDKLLAEGPVPGRGRTTGSSNCGAPVLPRGEYASSRTPFFFDHCQDCASSSVKSAKIAAMTADKADLYKLRLSTPQVKLDLVDLWAVSSAYMAYQLYDRIPAWGYY